MPLINYFNASSVECLHEYEFLSEKYDFET